MSQTGGAWGNPRVRFWSDPYRWPIDSSGHVFLARAVHHVGGIMFPDAWTGEEPITHYPAPLPPFEEAGLVQGALDRAQLLLFRMHETYRSRAHDPVFLPLPTREEWEIARKHNEDQRQANWPAYSRFLTAKHLLRDLFESGHLPTGVRAPAGGEVSRLHPSYWNGESAMMRFECCQMHPASPFTWEIVQRNGLWLFVDRRALEGFLELQRPRLPQPAQATHHTEIYEHLSEYLRFMVEQSRMLKLGEGSEIKHVVLVAELEKAWGARKPGLSARLLKSMATLMRSAEAQAGKGRRKAAG